MASCAKIKQKNANHTFLISVPQPLIPVQTKPPAGLSISITTSWRMQVCQNTCSIVPTAWRSSLCPATSCVMYHGTCHLPSTASIWRCRAAWYQHFRSIYDSHFFFMFLISAWSFVYRVTNWRKFHPGLLTTCPTSESYIYRTTFWATTVWTMRRSGREGHQAMSALLTGWCWSGQGCLYVTLLGLQPKLQFIFYSDDRTHLADQITTDHPQLVIGREIMNFLFKGDRKSVV